MSQNSSEEISVQKVFDEISKYLKNEQLYERLLNILHEEPNYKRLLRTGENQFFDAPSESSIEAESAKSRLSCAKINYLSVQIENDIDKIVQEKFQGEFLNTLKDQVLQAVLQLSSDHVSSSAAKASASAIKSEKNEQKTVLSQTNNCVQNGNGVKKEEDKITNGQAVSNLLATLDKGDPDLCIISFDDVSSVHTSDLSSFEDEISLSSDEEFGAKKRLSLKEVQEKLEKSQLEEMESEEADEEAMNNQAEDAQCNSAVNGNELSSMSQKSQRRRKPNLKYTEEDDLMPLKKKSVGKIPKSSRSVCGDTPRKRGRPRKHST